jgi:hypothetical protein
MVGPPHCLGAADSLIGYLILSVSPFAAGLGIDDINYFRGIPINSWHRRVIIQNLHGRVNLFW